MFLYKYSLKNNTVNAGALKFPISATGSKTVLQVKMNIDVVK